MKEQGEIMGNNFWDASAVKESVFEAKNVRVELYSRKSEPWGWIFMRANTHVKSAGTIGIDSEIEFAEGSSDAILMYPDGTIEVHGISLHENLEEQKAVYKDAISLMQLNGIEIPRPNPKYNKVENLIKDNLIDSNNAINPNDLKEGDLILIPNVDSGEFTRRSRDMVCAGRVEKISKYEGYKNYSWHIYLKDPSWFIPYEPFIPGEKHHIIGITNYAGIEHSLSPDLTKYDNSKKYDMYADFGMEKEIVEKLRLNPIHRLNLDLLRELRTIAPPSPE